MHLNSAGYAVMRQHWPHCGWSLIDNVIMMHSLSERPDLNLNVWVGSVQACLVLWAARWVQSQSHCMLTPQIKPCQWVLVLWSLVPSHMFSNKDSCDNKFKPLRERHPEKGENIGTSGQGVVELTCKPGQRTTADLTRSECVCARTVYMNACVFVLFLSCNWTNRPQRSQWLVN